MEELLLRAAAATGELAFIKEEGETKKRKCGVQHGYLKNTRVIKVN